MLKISQDGKQLSKLPTSKLADANILEKYVLEECIFNSWEQFCQELGEKLYLVNKEVNVYGNRIDLLAFDFKGNAVVIELKRGSDKLQLLQALSYASMISTWTLEQLLAKTPNQARADDLREALAPETTESEINGSQRILLVAEEFDHEVLATAEWLYGKDVDISCFRVSLAL